MDQANWVTPDVTLAPRRSGVERKANGKVYQRNDPTLMEQVRQSGQAVPANPSTDGSRQGSWATPEAKNHIGYQVGADGKKWPRLGSQVQWATPSCMDTLPARSPESLARAKEKGGCKNLREEVVQWATPQSRDAKGAEGRMVRLGNHSDLPSQIEVAPTGQWNRNNGKLNPRWVETLMGLPVGWVMPSCVSPVTIERTSCGSSATESCPPPQPELF